MDRLVCGDVGFGKTEVAVRAVFKAVQDGKQAAVLVPTTLLASQHAQTFADRYAPYPVRVELLSRFLSPASSAVVAGLADGSVDVVIGTHRLLAEDVAFKQLGLLVVDEEQRFGVTHKEAVKRMAEGVDVLTLTASPIPRTLEMALTGIRDLRWSTPLRPIAGPSSPTSASSTRAAVSEALRRELLREGQAFYVHNRVSDIDAVARDLRELVPEARRHRARADGRGQPRDGRARLLGAALRRAGLHDHHRVGHRHADGEHAHRRPGGPARPRPAAPDPRPGRARRPTRLRLPLPPGRPGAHRAGLRAAAHHRRAHRARGGFKIAMRDLEIRGAGNLSGADQSGHIAAVGYDLYVQLVAEAVAEAEGDAAARAPTVVARRPGDAHLPKDYVAAEDARLEAYRRLARRRRRRASTTSAPSGSTARAAARAREGLLALARAARRCLVPGRRRDRHEPVRPGGIRATRWRGCRPVALPPRPGQAAAPRTRRDLPRGPGPLLVRVPDGPARGRRRSTGLLEDAVPAGRCGRHAAAGSIPGA